VRVRGGVAMKPILKWAGIVAASLAGLLVLAIAYVFIGSQRMLDKSYPKRPSTVHAPGSTVYAPNLTIVTRSLSDADINWAIRRGLRSDGKSVLFMPSHGYAAFTDDEVASIIAYLRCSFRPQGAASPEPRLGLGVRVALVAGIVRTEAAEFHDRPPLDHGVRYEKGRHLAHVVCGQCHGTNLSGESKAPVHPTPNLLIVAGCDPGSFRALMRTGKAPAGREVEVLLKIARGNLSNFTDDEIHAIHAIYDHLVARWKVLTANQNAPSGAGPAQPPAQQPGPQDATTLIVPTAAEGVKVDRAERQRVIDAVIANLRQYYFDPGVAGEMVDALLAHQKRGDDDAVTDGGQFADLLTRQMRDVSYDMHLIVVYSQVPLPERPTEQAPESLARYRKAMEQENCMFKKVEILPHNIGYLKLNFFPDTSVCQATATAAMASLNHVDAIIFDLRDNTGGFPSMVSLIASYLFDHPEYMYNPREAPTRQSWTRSPVLGNKLADKPVYVLTSASTWSGAEQFSYDLKMLKRATLVGETTRGGAHAGVFHRIGDHFGMGIPETKAINPFSKSDWEGTGVEPDVKVKAADALQTAEKLAESTLRRKWAARNSAE
jgi:hypothetical protein